VRDQGIELDEERGYRHFQYSGLKTGEPPFKIPKGATTLTRISDWREGE